MIFDHTGWAAGWRLQDRCGKVSRRRTERVQAPRNSVRQPRARAAQPV